MKTPSPTTPWMLALRWAGIAAAVGVLAGLASAFFLWSLDRATQARAGAPWLLFLLPVAGAFIGTLYHRLGKEVEAGSDLLIDEIHEPEKAIPFRMTPMILGATLVTHLFGGSAGREGTAVQMGGSLADLLAGPLRLANGDRSLLLKLGVAAGFGSVFGTPFAGSIFAFEFLGSHRLSLGEALARTSACLLSALIGNQVTLATGVRHHVYSVPTTVDWSPALVGLVLVAGVLFGLTSRAFVEATHWLQGLGKGWKGSYWARPALGGFAVVLLTLAVGSQDYNGLGLPLMAQAFEPESVGFQVFALKLLFTAVTLGLGFKGGEVTPLLCIGATLGGAFGIATGQDPGLFAALGFVSVFAAAANTPSACFLMGLEMFGAVPSGLFLISLLAAYFSSGHHGIYGSQRLKPHVAARHDLPAETTIRSFRKARKRRAD